MGPSQLTTQSAQVVTQLRGVEHFEGELETDEVAAQPVEPVATQTHERVLAYRLDDADGGRYPTAHFGAGGGHDDRRLETVGAEVIDSPTKESGSGGSRTTKR
jgi:hypothetical protein